MNRAMVGVTVGTGAVIGAAAVVTKDVSDYAVAVGDPARVIKPRHDPDTAEPLQALAWWDWGHARLKAALPDLRTLTVAEFLEKYGVLTTAGWV